MNYSKSISPPFPSVGAPCTFSCTGTTGTVWGHTQLSARVALMLEQMIQLVVPLGTPRQMSKWCHKSPTNCWIRGNDWKSVQVGLECGSSGVGTTHRTMGLLQGIPVGDWGWRGPQMPSATSDFSTHSTSISLHAGPCWKQGRSRSIAKCCGRLFRTLASICPPPNTWYTYTWLSQRGEIRASPAASKLQPVMLGRHGGGHWVPFLPSPWEPLHSQVPAAYDNVGWGSAGPSCLQCPQAGCSLSQLCSPR